MIRDNNRLNVIAERIEPGSKPVGSRPLEGGVSARVTAIDLQEQDGTTRTVVVREPGDADLARNPHVARDEFETLRILCGTNVPVPAPYFVDESCTILDRPYVVIEFIDGRVIHEPGMPHFISQLAETLAAIHQTPIPPGAAFLRDYTTYVQECLVEQPVELDEALSEGRVRSQLRRVASALNVNPPTLLHGDYWHGNTLWRGADLAAVIDWEDAGTGDPLADVANCRLETLWAFGVDAMHEFTECYRDASPNIAFENLPAWDLSAALRPAGRMKTWGLSKTVEQEMQVRHAWFVDQAIQAL